MLKELAELANLLRNAKEIGERFESLLAQLREERISGSAGGGLVKVEVNGLAEPLQVRIDPAILRPEDKDLLEELLAGAIRDAIRKARERHFQLLGEISGGLRFPGFEAAARLFTGMDGSGKEGNQD